MLSMLKLLNNQTQIPMKKLSSALLMLMLLSTGAFSQSTYSKFRDEYYGKGIPVFTPATYPSFAVDTLARKVYRKMNSSSMWMEMDGWLKDVYLPADETTPPPPTNPMEILVPYLCPQAFGAIGEDKTFAQIGWTQEKINNTYPGITVTTSDNVDWAAVQYCFYKQKIEGKAIFWYGNLYMGNDDVVLAKELLSSSVYGGMANIFSRAATVFRRETPADNGQANVMITNAQYHWQDFAIRCQNNLTQTGIRLFSVYPVRMECVKVYNANRGFNMIFCLQGVMESCEANTCNDGFYLEDGTTYYTTTKDWSQNNVFKFESCRAYMPTSGRYGFYVGSSNTVYNNNPVIEGFHCNSAIFVNGNNSTTVKGTTILGAHVEVTGTIYQGAYIQNPIDVAAFNIELAGGTAIIIDPYGQHPCKMVRIKATQGYIYAVIQWCQWWESRTSGVANPSGKMFENAGGGSWTFRENEGPLFSETTVVNQYCTPVPRKYNGPGTGDNCYNFYPVPR